MPRVCFSPRSARVLHSRACAIKSLSRRSWGSIVERLCRGFFPYAGQRDVPTQSVPSATRTSRSGRSRQRVSRHISKLDGVFPFAAGPAVPDLRLLADPFVISLVACDEVLSVQPRIHRATCHEHCESGHRRQAKSSFLTMVSRGGRTHNFAKEVSSNRHGASPELARCSHGSHSMTSSRFTDAGACSRPP